VDPADQEAVRQISRKACTEGKPFEIVYGITTPAGEKRVIRELGYAVRDEAGKVARLVGTAQDITLQAQVEAELRWKTAFLEAQVDSSLDGIMVVNGEGKKILQNQRLNQLWKLPLHIASAVDDREQARFIMQQMRNPQAFIERMEYLYAHPDEVSRDEIELLDGRILDRYSAPVVGKDGVNYGRIRTYRDITEQRRLETQLRQAQKMEAIGQLAGGVAHDFNNMLAVIRGNADLLLMGGDQLGTETSLGLKQIIAAAERAAKLTRQLLMFSRKQVMQPQPLALDGLVQDLLKMLQRIIREDIRLECVCQNESSLVEADAGMIEQVLLNLVVNARDAMPHGGLVRIATEKVALAEEAARRKPEARAGDFVCLSVSDNGTGIAPEHLQRIFEPFFTTKEVGKGTGLGLATVYGIVKQHQGWIEVSSQVGQGTTFRVFVPAIPPSAAAGAAQAMAPKLRGGTETILLVEDDASVRLVTRRVLESYGYTVCEASCGREALETWGRQAGEIMLLLSDIVMPEGLTGRDLAQQMRAEKPGLRVILMSGYSAEVMGKGTEFLRRTKTYFLQKPCPSSTLLQTVRQCLDEK
jgi:signal transduction histidine kinase/ActR/RegA family two-component response regulator